MIAVGRRRRCGSGWCPRRPAGAAARSRHADERRAGVEARPARRDTSVGRQRPRQRAPAPWRRCRARTGPDCGTKWISTGAPVAAAASAAHLGLVPVGERVVGEQVAAPLRVVGGRPSASARRRSLPVVATTEKRGSTSPSCEQRHGGEQHRGGEAAGMADVARPARRPACSGTAQANSASRRRRAVRRGRRPPRSSAASAKRKSAERSTTVGRGAGALGGGEQARRRSAAEAPCGAAREDGEPLAPSGSTSAARGRRRA